MKLFIIGWIYIAIIVLLFGGRGQPQKGEWVCFASYSENQGTYGWSRSKIIAREIALKLCEEEFNGKCYIDYCEKK